MQLIFLSVTKCLWLPQYVNKFLVWHKKFGPAQNILGPVKRQGIRILAKYRAFYILLGSLNFLHKSDIIWPIRKLDSESGSVIDH